MNSFPECCPRCGDEMAWKEVINPVTTGIPLGKHIRIRFLSIRGLFSGVIKDKLGMNKVTYRCENCGFEGVYDLE